MKEKEVGRGMGKRGGGEAGRRESRRGGGWKKGKHGRGGGQLTHPRETA